MSGGGPARDNASIFISHTEKDAALALAVALGLEQGGYATWSYKIDGLGAVSYLVQSKQAIDVCNAMVLIISPSSVQSNQVGIEVIRAHERNKRFVPVLYGLTHEEFRSQEPEWGGVLGASTAIELKRGDTSEAMSRILKGLTAIGIRPGEPAAERIATIRQRLETAGEPLIDVVVPVSTKPSRPLFRWGMLATLAVAAVASLAVLWATTRTPPPPADGNRIAVLEFENQKPNDAPNSWYSTALQKAVNTGLSKIEQLEVIDVSFIAREASEQSVDFIEAARRLRVGRLIKGSYVVDSDQMRIDAMILETENGRQKEAGSVVGAIIDFFKLQAELEERMLEKFNFQLTMAQGERMRAASAENAAKPETVKKSKVDKYRQLLESEGVTSGPPQPPAKVDPQAMLSDDESLLTFAAFARPALAQAPIASREEVLAFLESYREAYESRNIDRLAALYVAFPPAQARSVANYMSGIDDLRVELNDVDIQISNGEVAVTYTRRDTFVDKETEEEISLDVRLTRFLVKDPAGFKFAATE